jgi:CarboxypepD_reg-like domain
MKNRNRFVIEIVATVLLMGGIGLWLSSCSKSSNPTGPGNSSNPTGKATVTGIVNDASTTGSPAIAGAVVSIAGTSTSDTTDAKGMFSISVPNDTVTINVTKSGYSLNEVVVYLKGDSTENLTVSLMKAGTTKTVSASSGGSVTDPNSDAIISMPPNFVSASGNVNVTVTGLDPTTDQIKALPGGLEAVDANGNTEYLKPVSFAEYTVTDANGNVLQFNTSAGAGMNIELPIPASLRGQPGYGIGDHIECYLFDPSDGKWKSPVDGVIGNSSVNSSIPVIKATIMHLSWYGGAPAVNQRACIKGYVKNANGTPAVGAAIDAYPGGEAVTDKNGYYDVDAAPSSNVRIVATIYSGTTVSTAEGVVYTGAVADSCYTSPDLTLGLPQQGNFEVDANLFKLGSGGSYFDEADVTINLMTANGDEEPWDSADVEIGYNNQFVNVPSTGSGNYQIFNLLGGNFTLTPGVQYQIKVDFDKNGTFDATGSVRMVGITQITYPADGDTVQPMFTATWSDSGSTNPGYSANYWLSLSGDSASLEFLTTQTSQVIGDGSTDSLFYGYVQTNDPLPPGDDYYMSILTYNGPNSFLSTYGAQLPNINGQNVIGYFDSYFIGEDISFSVAGLSKPLALTRPASSSRRWKVPTALRKFYKSLPLSVRKKIKSPLVLH